MENTNLFDSFLTIVGPVNSIQDSLDVVSYKKGELLSNGTILSLHIQAFNDFITKRGLDGPIINEVKDASHMIIQMAYLSSLGYTVFCNLKDTALLSLANASSMPTVLEEKMLQDCSTLSNYSFVSVGTTNYLGKDNLPEVIPLLDFDPQLEGIDTFKEMLNVYKEDSKVLSLKAAS